MNIDFVLLTPVEIEYKTVLKYLKEYNIHTNENPFFSYTIGLFKTDTKIIKIAVIKTHSGIDTVGIITERAISLFKPKYIFLVGIAGGIKDVNLGDIVIGLKAYNYEFGKEKLEGFVGRPQVFNNPNHQLIALAEDIGRKENWFKRVKNKNKNIPFVYSGPIAAGNKVITTTKSSIYKLLKTSFEDTLALEMEASGFAKSLSGYPDINYLNIRSISDLLDDKAKTEEEGYQSIAAEHAIAFTFEIINQLVKKQKSVKASSIIKYSIALIVFISILILVINLSNNSGSFFFAINNNITSKDSLSKDITEQKHTTPLNKIEKKELTKKDDSIPLTTSDKKEPVGEMNLVDTSSVIIPETTTAKDSLENEKKDTLINKKLEEPISNPESPKKKIQLYKHRFYADLNGEHIQKDVSFIVTSKQDKELRIETRSEKDIELPKGKYDAKVIYKGKTLFTKSFSVPATYRHTKVDIFN